MKKTVYIMAAMLALSLTMAAAVFAWSSTATLLTDASDNATVGNIWQPMNTYKTWGCDVRVSGGSPSVVSVCLQGNEGGEDLWDLVCHSMTNTELTNRIGGFSVDGVPARKLRGKLVTLTGGTAVKVSLKCTGSD
jgi:hypothetical protein